MSVLLDDTDLHVLKLYNWWATKNGNVTYMKAHIDGHAVYLHRFLLSPPADLLVDHINGNGLDNRRSNLQLVSKSENLHNRHTNKRLKGVSLKRGMFLARFKLPNTGLVTCLDVFITEEQAGKAYDAYVRKNYPELEWLCNFPRT